MRKSTEPIPDLLFAAQDAGILISQCTNRGIKVYETEASKIENQDLRFDHCIFDESTCVQEYLICFHSL